MKTMLCTQFGTAAAGGSFCRNCGALFVVKTDPVKRAWLIFLFAVSLVMVLVVIPYELIKYGELMLGYRHFGLLFFLCVGRYAYIRIFHPRIAAEEEPGCC